MEDLIFHYNRKTDKFYLLDENSIGFNIPNAWGIAGDSQESSPPIKSVIVSAYGDMENIRYKARIAKRSIWWHY